MTETKTQDTQAVGRRSFLKGGATAVGGVAAAGAIAMPNVSRAQTVTLRMQGAWGAADIFNEMAQEYVTRVEQMSGGRLKIDYQVSGAVVKAFQVQDAVHNGVLDGGHHVTGYWYGKNKAASLFGTGPIYGCNAAQMIAWFHKGGGKELYKELVQDILKLNIVGFVAMPMPAQPLGWFNKEVNNAQDMEGLKYRTVGLATDVMQAMGVNVTQLPGGEIVPAMERGVIESFEFNNPTSDSRFGAQDVAKNYYLSSYHQAIEYFEIIFNSRRFDALPAEHKAILEYAAEAANTANYATAMDNYSRDLVKVEDAGVTVRRTDQSILKAQLDAWDKVLVELEKDPFFKKVTDSQRAWAARVGRYAHLAEADFRLAYDHYNPGVL